LAWGLLVLGVFSYFEGRFGKTPGKWLLGALLVALTENWQRLGDLAARTIVVTDEKPA
jgi:uncharacterized RDD family membrane protein YckC